MPRPPVYQAISADLTGKIRSGEWPPGRRIPFEHELTAQYACSRATVNKAIMVLVDSGLVERRRRAGSFVARPHVSSAVLHIPDIEAEVTARGQVYGYELERRSVRKVRRNDPDEAHLASVGAVLSLACRHLANGRPFAAEDRIIDLAAVPEAMNADFTAAAPGAWLLAHVAWSEAEHRIAAVGADAALAERLALASGEACLSVKRWTWRQGVGITFARQVFPGEAYDLVARFTPAG